MIDLEGFLWPDPERRLWCFFGSSPSGNTNTVQSSSPWSGEQGYLIGNPTPSWAPNGVGGAITNDVGGPGVYGAAQALFTNPGPQYYPGSTYAPLTQAQQDLIAPAVARGEAGGGAALRGANSSVSNILDPAYLNPWNSPSFNTVVGNTLAAALPAATSSFANGNRSDSGLATRAATMAATDAVGNLAQNQYAANQQNQIKAMGLAPLIDSAQSADLQAGMQGAGMAQTDLQNQIQAAMSRYNYGQMLPWNQLSLYENAITGAGNPGGTTSTSQPYFSNPVANIIGAGAGLAGIGSAANSAGLFSAATYAPLMALLSDERAKEDIHRIGESDSGFPLYTFRYKGESPMAMHIGLMAQDVEKERPSAVMQHPSGFKMVDYIQALAA